MCCRYLEVLRQQAILERAASSTKPGRAGPGQKRSTERRVFSPEAAALCQPGRGLSDALPRLSAQVLEPQHTQELFLCQLPRPAQTSSFSGCAPARAGGDNDHLLHTFAVEKPRSHDEFWYEAQNPRTGSGVVKPFSVNAGGGGGAEAQPKARELPAEFAECAVLVQSL